MRPAWVRAAAAAGIAVVLLPAAGCSWFRHGSTKCHEPTVPANLANGPPLKMPPGLESPDTRGAVRIPQLKEPELPRAPSDPCLSAPPDYKSAQP